MSLSIVGDIGGTNTRLALCEDGVLSLHTARQYLNRDFSGLDEVIEAYLAEFKRDAGILVVGVAGPVKDGSASLTNLPWRLDAKQLGARLRFDFVVLLNDLVAAGHALTAVRKPELRCYRSAIENTGSKLVIGIGTGLNTSLVIGAYKQTASTARNFETKVLGFEFGHSSLPYSMAQILAEETGGEPLPADFSAEEVMSGRGLIWLHRFLNSPSDVGSSSDAEGIVRAYTQNGDVSAGRTLKIFNRLFGALCANLVCQYLPNGGIYAAGSVARNALRAEFLPDFETAYKSATMQRLLDTTSISIITDPLAALEGCAIVAANITAD